MPTFERSIIVEAPRERLFWWMQDYRRRLEWDEFLSAARLIDAERAEVGVRAWCVDKSGRGMETVYVSFRPPERVAVEMTRGPWIFKSFAGSWVYRDVGQDRTEVSFRYHVEARIGVGRLGDWILERIFARAMEHRLRGLAKQIAAGAMR